MLYKSGADRKKETLEKIIKSIVAEITIVCTDQAKMYDSLDEIGYMHFYLCHKTNFVDPKTGCHRQTIESLWNHIKKKKHMVLRENGWGPIVKSSLFRTHKDMKFENYMEIL